MPKYLDSIIVSAEDEFPGLISVSALKKLVKVNSHQLK